MNGKFIVLAVMSSLVTSCATWKHPTKGAQEFNEDNYQCMQDAAQSYPVNMQSSGGIHAYQSPSHTNCNRFGNQVDCTTTPGTTYPSLNIQQDVNANYRAMAAHSCLRSRGWTLDWNK